MPVFRSPVGGLLAFQEASVDVDTAVSNAVRLLEASESELDLAKMERWTALADSWISVAVLLSEREAA